jgi:diguanylate cyclase (GGDEF)-like protein
MNKTALLIVDDEPINLQMAAECLSADYDIFVARSGFDALTLLQHQSVGLILLDIGMPEMDGFATAESIAALPHCAAVPIIYLTADNSEETISKAFDTGAADYVIKPFKRKELLARVKNRLETERLKQEQHDLLKRNTHLIELIKSHVAYLKTDVNGIVTEVSASLCDLFLCKESNEVNCFEYFIGNNVNLLKSGSTPLEQYQRLWQSLAMGEVFTHEIEDKHPSGTSAWYRVTIAPDVDENGQLVGYIAFYLNIDKEVRFEHEATTDYLTGLWNRAKFDRLFHDELIRAQRYLHPFSLILADIDHFKTVNDDYGHLVGDAVLKDFAQLLSQNIRQTDSVARWGGEEFIILCPNTDKDGVMQLAEKLRQVIQNYCFTTIGHKTASFGVATYYSQEDGLELFRNVDKALYQAKEGGRNKVVSFVA